MKLSAELGRVGATLVKEKITETKATLFIRVAEERGQVWIEALSSLLLSSADKKEWSLDVSKYFYVSNGAVRYLWRIVIDGETSSCLEHFSRLAFEAAMANRKELDSFPLVGRARYEIDPALGKLKGGHSMEQASSYVAMHFAK